MRRLAKNKIYSNEPGRLNALAVCVLFIVVSVLYSALIIARLNHAHDHNGVHGSCATCACLTKAENLLKSISVAVFSVALVFEKPLLALFALKLFDFRAGFYTLARLKVRLNN
jgi:hypothetical protein